MIARNNAVVAVYKSHAEAEAAVKELQQAGFDMKKLSVVGCDYHTDEEVIGYYNTGNRMKHWGKAGAFWGEIWGLLFGSAFFLVPGIGPLLVAGPLVGWIVGGLEGAVMLGGLSALGAGLYSLGIPKDSILQYEAVLKTGKFVLIAHDSDVETIHARDIIKRTNPEALAEHQPSRANPEPELVTSWFLAQDNIIMGQNFMPANLAKTLDEFGPASRAYPAAKTGGEMRMAV